MNKRSRIFSLLAGAALAASLCFAPAVFAAPITADSSDTVIIGTVVSSQPRIDEDTDRVLTDVVVAQGSQLDSVVMEGGEVGALGMWTELYFPVAVGQEVAVSVAETGQGLAATAAPVVFGIEPTESGQVISASLAGYDRGDREIEWSTSSLPVGYYVNTTYAPAGALEAVKAAAQAWEDDPGSDMDFTFLGTTTAVAADASDDINVVDWGLSEQSGTLALCTIWYSTPSYRIREFSIQFNRAHPWATDQNPNAFDVQSVGTHELGHTLHLKDLYEPENAMQTMYGYGARGSLGPRTLEWGDRAGVAAIYPSATPPSAASNTLGFSLTSSFTRVTGSGTFTISAAGALAEFSHFAYHVDGGAAVTVNTTSATFAIKPGQHAVTFWGFDKAGNRGDTQTVVVQVKSKPGLTRPVLSPSSPRRNRTFAMSGKIGSADVGRTRVSFVIQRRVGGRWVAYKTVRTTLATGKKAFSVKTKLARTGTFRVRTTHAADAMHVSGVSSWRTFTVRR